MENTQVNSAIKSAKTILAFDLIFFVFVVKMAAVWWLSKSLADLDEFANLLKLIVIFISLIWYVPLVFIINWFVSYGELQSNEEVFVEVKRSLKMSCVLWIAANLLNVLLLNFTGWFSF